MNMRTELFERTLRTVNLNAFCKQLFLSASFVVLAFYFLNAAVFGISCASGADQLF
ncbi:hypothetical protein [Roseivirga thermotolerans]|uniref:hypothetical protein n=1 Tax=Roseivirga thermotolerans TaxID=1758176 RepID=UPI00273E702D|nr:hypothetical protein [Roseivirga thermotolerans]